MSASAEAVSAEAIAQITAGAGARAMPLLPVFPRSFSDVAGGLSFLSLLVLGPAAHFVLLAMPWCIGASTASDVLLVPTPRSRGNASIFPRAIVSSFVSACFVALFWATESGVLSHSAVRALNEWLGRVYLPPADESIPRAALITGTVSLVVAFIDARALQSQSLSLAQKLTRTFDLAAFAIPAVFPTASMFLGPWSPLVLLLLLLQACALIIFAGAATPALGGSRALAAGLAGVWAMWSASVWGATAHAPRLSALAYGAGLVGWRAFSAPRAGAALLFNTFGISHILIAGPLLATPFALSASIGAGLSAPQPQIFPIFLFAAHAATLTASATLCAVESRHLMTWSVFAPKFLFEVAGAAAHAVSTAALLFSLETVNVRARSSK